MHNRIVFVAGAIVILILIILGTLAASASAETLPKINHVEYNITDISGCITNIEKGNIYYIRVTLLVHESVYIIFEKQINENGMWIIDLCYSADYIILHVVDKPYTFIPGQYRVYDIIGIPVDQ